MPAEQQATFSRTSLNILILVCIVLILIFGQASQDNGQITLPIAPKLDISIWQTDSGASVWFNPKLADDIYIELHYLAGFSYNQAPFSNGTSQLLVSLFNHQARQLTLPAHATLSPDFIEISIKLNTDALIMRQQIKQLNTLLYRPALKAQALTDAKNILPSPLDELWQTAYEHHPYEGPKRGTQASVSGIHRAAVQQFQQGFLHPERLFASITGNLTEHTAQLIMESLLPKSVHSQNQQKRHDSKPSNVYQQVNMGLVVLPGSYEQAQQLADQMMMINILKQLKVTQLQFVSANANNSLIVEQWPSLLTSIDTDLDSDTMRQAKRQSVKEIMARTQTAAALSQFLVLLNRYHLPSSFIHSQFSVIEKWQQQDWQRIKQQWLSLSKH